MKLDWVVGVEQGQTKGGNEGWRVAVALTENMPLTETNTDTTRTNYRKYMILKMIPWPIIISVRYLAGVSHNDPLKPDDVLQLD
jgi:hypothetical protein